MEFKLLSKKLNPDNNQKINQSARVKTLALFIFVLFPQVLFGMVYHEKELVRCARKTFSHISSLSELLEKTENLNQGCRQGAVFELETGLYLQNIMHEKIEAFNLEIIFKNDYYNTTEYDCVTEHFLIEAKSCQTRSMERNHEKITKQVAKEEEVVLWFKVIQNAISKKTIQIGISQEKNRNVYLHLKGECTDNEIISITTPSIWQANDLEECKSQWLELIESLSQKEFLFVSRHLIPDNLRKELDELLIPEIENIRYSVRRATI